MNAPLLNPAMAQLVARELFLLLHRGQAEWFDLAWGASVARKTVANLSDGWQSLPGLGAVGVADPAMQKMARDFAVMATTFLIESPTARSELLLKLKEACSKRGFAQPIQKWITQAAEEILGQQNNPSTTHSRSEKTGDTSNIYLVWRIRAHEMRCGEPELCDSSSFFSRFWDQRGDYDLFVNGRLVFAPKLHGNQEIKLDENEYRALVFLLLKRGQPIAPLKLYSQVYERNKLAPGLVEADIMASHMRPLMSKLRNALETSVPALDIPDKRRMRGYALQGAFDSCLTLLQSEAEAYLVAAPNPK